MGLLANLELNIVKLKQYEEETEKAKEPQKKHVFDGTWS